MFLERFSSQSFFFISYVERQFDFHGKSKSISTISTETLSKKKSDSRFNRVCSLDGSITGLSQGHCGRKSMGVLRKEESLGALPTPRFHSSWPSQYEALDCWTWTESDVDARSLGVTRDKVTKALSKVPLMLAGHIPFLSDFFTMNK